MAKPRDTQRTRPGALERLRARLPDFRGYLEVAERRAADRALRDHGADRLQRASRDLAEVTRGAPSDERRELEELVTQLEKLRAELCLADRSYSDFFGEEKLDQTALDTVYAQDERVVEQIDELGAQVTDAETSAGKLRGSVRRLGFALADRRNAILGLRAR